MEYNIKYIYKNINGGAENKLMWIIKAPETGNKFATHDDMFTFVPGSCFEIASAINILDTPGKAGKFLDQQATHIADIISKIYDTSFGNTKVNLSSGQTTLREYFDLKILKELIPSSDQVGRCLDPKLETAWYKGEGKKWLCEQLKVDCNTDNYNYKNMLTKIRAMCALGAIFREMMPQDIPQNAEIIAAMIGNSQTSNTIQNRVTEIIMKIRHRKFDDPTTKARTEKIPIIDNKLLSSYTSISISLISTRSGNIFHVTAMKPLNQEGRAVIEKYKQLESTKGRQGMERQGQDIKNADRPGILGESSMALLPDAFNQTNF